MWIVVIIGAVIGGIIGRWPGALVGGVLGFVVAQLARMLLFKGALGTIRAQFLDSTFAVMGAICKADGRVTQDEIQVAEELFTKLHLGEEQKRRAREAFNRGKAPEFDLDGEVARFASVARGQRALYQMFLQIQIAAIAADGAIDADEHGLLSRVARGLGLSEAEIEQLEAMLGVRDSAASGDGLGSTAGQSSEEQLNEAYKVLGVDSSASDSEIKKAYRRQMSANHPDKLASKGMPDSMREMAEQKTREIGAAYERVSKARGIA